MLGLTANCVSVALHEWAAVVGAMAAGEQTILLRKGGIHEPGGRFRLDHEKFLLYPTFTHQQAEDLRAPWSGRQPAATESGRATFTHWAEVVEALQAPSGPECIEKWLGFHIYTPELIRKRLAYKPHQPLHLLVIRVHRLPAPVSIIEPAGHHACVSWVELPEAFSLEGSAPVLSDDQFRQKVDELKRALAAGNAGPDGRE